MEGFWSRFWGFWIVLMVILYGWQSLSKDEYVEFYNLKTALASYSVLGEKADLSDQQMSDANLTSAHVVALMETMQPSVSDTDARVKRALAKAFGETDLRYHFKYKSGNFVPASLDFSTNILYNFSYIVNTPSKLIHNIKTDFKMDEVLSLAGSNVQTKSILWIAVIWDVLHAVTGVGAAFIMLFFGCLIGLLYHPLHSILNAIPVLWQLVVTTWHAVSYLFNLFR